jgi:hypothetical protein
MYLLAPTVNGIKARKSNIWEFYQLVSSYENGENSLEFPIILYEILFFFKNEQLLV